MNKAKLKAYAPQARKDFIAAATARAQRLGLSEVNGQFVVAPAELAGDLVMIAGQSWPAKISSQRDKLIELIDQDGYQQSLEAVAYTWFNRFAALRYMEIHDYLNHGYRVLSSREGGLPEILNHAAELAQNGDLPSLNAQKVKELKLAGDQDGELYRLTLIAQCNALSSAIPFLFECIGDETELLLPDNLLLTDSVVAKLVAAIPEEDWSQVEIIGWLYQFYISEKKDQVIGKVVKSEDIPAATQLFTPNWIVQYLVQTSIGRLWLMANPASTLKNDWPYYIEPAEQTPEVQAQLDALIQARLSEDSPLPEGEGPGVRGTLNPETITVLDPACGSGHILVEAYEVLKAIYLERGYQPRSIPRQILEKNLYGLDIDDRAAQLAGFALLMKARADDRRLFDNSPKLNVLALQESKGLDAGELAQALKSVRAEPVEAHFIKQLINTFAYAKTFGSLIQIPQDLNEKLAAMEEALQQALRSEDLLTQAAAFNLLPLVQQARILGMQFDAVLANPPYMGSNYFSDRLRQYSSQEYAEGNPDLYGCFILRNLKFAKRGGVFSMITIPNWMFLTDFKALRDRLLNSATLDTLIHNGRGAFGSDFGSCSFCVLNVAIKGYNGIFRRLFDKQGSVATIDELEQRFFSASNFYSSTAAFDEIPERPIAYWTTKKLRSSFINGVSLGALADPRQGIKTGNNELFLRYWSEVPVQHIGFNFQDRPSAERSGKRWFPCTKGGAFRKWYGNHFFVVDWEEDGKRIRSYTDEKGRLRSRPQNIDLFFRPGITWSKISISSASMRYFPPGFAFESIGSVCFPKQENDLFGLMDFLNSAVSAHLLKIVAPSVDFGEGALRRLPVLREKLLESQSLVERAIHIAKRDWDGDETSWDFSSSPVVPMYSFNTDLMSAWLNWSKKCDVHIDEMRSIEVAINRVFIDAYGLQDEVSPEVPDEQITLARADREKDCQRLISYTIGCMMGRYSLDKPGLIYAHAGNVGFDPGRYNTFPADADGIVPITDELWFEDDAANRIREFLLAVWDAKTLDENMAWLAESLGQRGDETPEATIRRYIASSFFKDHLQTYKKRPIYWLFSSGKQGAFQALVYLHRYHEGTLSRMRTEYVVPLMGKLQSRLEMLAKDAASADSNAARNKLNKDIEKLKKKHVELLAYDEKLRHYADLRIHLDLDDGVKVNYGKFGDLLAEVKAIVGGAGDD